MSVILAAGWGGGRLGRAELEVLGAASRLASQSGTSVAYAAFGPGAEAAASESTRSGAAGIALESAEKLSAEAMLDALAALASEMDADVILLPSDALGGELGPRLSGRLAGVAITDVVEMRVEDGRPLWTRPVFGGKAWATIEALRRPVIATLRARSFEPATLEFTSESVQVRALGPAGRVKVISQETMEFDGPRLEDARVVVAGGRGVSPEAFEQIEKLAELLGGAVGASLAAVDQGWAPASKQVGLTGKIVSPDVYFAVGISGASQHLAGLASVKALVAVNNDPKAPIFNAARLGVVMDCHKLLPALLAETRRRLSD